MAGGAREFVTNTYTLFPRAISKHMNKLSLQFRIKRALRDAIISILFYPHREQAFWYWKERY